MSTQGPDKESKHRLILLIVLYPPAPGEKCCSTVGKEKRNGQWAGKKWELFTDDS